MNDTTAPNVQEPGMPVPPPRRYQYRIWQRNSKWIEVTSLFAWPDFIRALLADRYIITGLAFITLDSIDLIENVDAIKISMATPLGQGGDVIDFRRGQGEQK